MKTLILVALLLCSPASSSAETIRVAFATGEWPPFTSETLPGYGSAAVLVSAISRVAGIEPVFQFYPWKRAELKVLKGEVFAAFPYAISSEREALFGFSETLFYGLNVLMYHSDNPHVSGSFKYQSPADLHGYRVGGISGSFLSAALDQAGIEFEATTSLDQSIHKLVAGRIDFCIDDKVVLTDAIQRLYPNEAENFRFLPKPFGEKKPTALLISRTYPGAGQILERFNAALGVLKKSGEYDRIIKELKMIK